jgi:hypothetical protein
LQLASLGLARTQQEERGGLGSQMLVVDLGDGMNEKRKENQQQIFFLKNDIYPFKQHTTFYLLF